MRSPAQRWLDQLTLGEAARLLEAGEFAEGSMKPKIEALMAFVSASDGGVGLLTSPDRLADALAGQAGTRVVA